MPNELKRGALALVASVAILFASVGRVGVAFADTDATVADAVQKAAKAGDDAAIEAAAAKNDPDPWLVVDLLLARGDTEAALKFARAKPRAAVDKLPAYVEAAAKRGDDAEARDLATQANRLVAGKKHDEALALLPTEPTGDTISVVIQLGVRGLAHGGNGAHSEAIAPFLRGGEIAERIGWLTRASALFQSAGLSGYHGGDGTAACAAWERRVVVQRTLGTSPALATTLLNLGIVYRQIGRSDESLDRLRAEGDVWEELDEPVRRAASLARVGNAYRERNEFARAREFIDEAFEIAEEHGDDGAMAEALTGLASLEKSMAQPLRALESYRLALPVVKRTGNQHMVGYVHNSMGVVYMQLGQPKEAIAAYELARARWAESGSAHDAALVVTNIGIARSKLGDLAGALEMLEGALAEQERLDDRLAAARSVNAIAVIYSAIGEWEKSRAYYERALALHEAAGDHQSVAHVLQNIGSVLLAQDDLEGARPFFLDALERLQKLDAVVGQIAVHVNLARVEMKSGEFETSAKHLSTAEELIDASDTGGLRPQFMTIVAELAEARNHPAAALARYSELAVYGTETSNPEAEADGLSGAARAHLALGDPRAALNSAHAAVDRLASLVGRLADSEGAQARSVWSELYDTGTSAAIAADDPGELSYFVESGRAGALLEALTARDAIQSAALSPDLVEAERVARVAENAAVRAHQVARDSKKLRDIVRTRKELAAATADRAAVIARLQREAKAAANVLYPTASSLEEIQGALGSGEVLISYIVADSGAAALVVTESTAKIVSLGAPDEIADACTALMLDDTTTDGTAALTRVRKLVLEPLALSDRSTRILISPDGPIAFVPFATIAGKLQVAYVASGSTLVALGAERGVKGEGVLALGDPVYGSEEESAGAVALHRGSANLQPLPGTRAEAKAVGTRILLGADASETRFIEEVTSTPRWRAVHLACHGLVNPDQPMQSSLALSKSDDDDGFLTALDVFQIRVPSDLVVLSACETGRGRQVRGEGLVGLTRAFMFAGSPRVIVSLWKVDDQATRALMERFHASWKAGKPASEALQEAQAWVREQAQWKHPAYWAAWVLWGLPE